MAKIPFNIKFKPQIESGEYKVETRDGKTVRIICWDMDSYNPVVALVANYPNYNGSLSEHIFSYSMDGHYSATCSSDEDLFIVTPEEELTEFENAFGQAMMEVPEPEEKEEWYQFLKEKSAELLAIAREQFINDGYVIEKKAFHDAVEKVDPKIMEEVSDNIDKKISENSGQLNEFEKRIKDLLAIKCEIFYNQDIGGCYDLKGLCDAILACAYKELQPEIETEIKKAYKNARKVMYRKGKEEALKDLPNGSW